MKACTIDAGRADRHGKIPYADRNTAEPAVRHVLASNRFKEVTKKGEVIWKKGGFWTAAQCLKLEFGPQEMNLYGWVRNFGMAESDLSGVVGIIPKKQLLNVIEQIKLAVR